MAVNMQECVLEKIARMAELENLGTSRWESTDAKKIAELAIENEYNALKARVAELISGVCFGSLTRDWRWASLPQYKNKE